jgi:hypothetical protein
MQALALLTVANPVPPISMVSVPLMRAEESSGCFYIVLRVMYGSLWGDKRKGLDLVEKCYTFNSKGTLFMRAMR